MSVYDEIEKRIYTVGDITKPAVLKEFVLLLWLIRILDSDNESTDFNGDVNSTWKCTDDRRT